MLHENATGLVGAGVATAGAVDGARRVLLHASCVELFGTGVVLLGEPGSGKSDLALRLIDGGAQLVSDDRLAVERHGDVLIGRPPEAIAGLIEVRGMGIMRIGHCASTSLGLAVSLQGSRSRLPECMTYELLGLALPRLELDPRAPSACAKVRLALTAERVE